MRVRKMLCGIIASLMFVCLITGCSDAATGYKAVQKNKELKVLIEPWSDYELNSITEAFKKAYPDIKLTICNADYYGVDPETKNWGEVKAKVETEIMAGNGPDVIVLDDNRLFSDINKTIKTGVFYDLNNILNKNQNYDKADYLEAAMEAGQYDGKQYIFPAYLHTPMFVTTQEIIDDTGVNLDNCKNFLGLLKELDGYHNRVGSDNKRSSIVPANYKNLSLLNAYDDEVIFNTPEIIDALETYKVCEKNSSMHTNTSTLEDEHIGLFNYNKIVFSDRYGGYTALDLAAILDVKYDPILLPKYNSKGQIQAELQCGIAVSANSPNMDNVEKFFDVLLTNDTPFNALDDTDFLNLPFNKGKYDNIPDDERYRYERISNSISAKKSRFKSNLECKRKKLSEGYVYYAYDEVEQGSAKKCVPLSDECYAAFEDMYNNIEVCILPAWSMQYRIYEYFAPYFNDEATLEECIQVAQNALEIYISE